MKEKLKEKLLQLSRGAWLSGLTFMWEMNNDFCMLLLNSALIWIALHTLLTDIVAVIADVVDALFTGNYHAGWLGEHGADGQQRGDGKQTRSTLDQTAASQERRRPSGWLGDSRRWRVLGLSALGAIIWCEDRATCLWAFAAILEPRLIAIGFESKSSFGSIALDVSGEATFSSAVAQPVVLIRLLHAHSSALLPNTALVACEHEHGDDPRGPRDRS